MLIQPFELERWQSHWEHVVEFNLAESGVDPLALRELLPADQREALLDTPLGYIQTNGTEALRGLIADLHPGSTIDNVLVTAGSAEANFLVVWSMIEPGDEVLFQLPNFLQVAGLLEAFGARVRRFELRQALGWQPDLDQLDALVSDRTKMIVVTNPNNPTGAQLSAAARRHLVALADRVGAWILCDEVYRGAEREGELTATLWGDYDRVLVTGGLSKAYGLPGLRLGWLVAPEDVAARAWTYHDYTTIAVSALSDRLGRVALEPAGRQRLRARTRGILESNYAVISEWLARQEIFDWVAPRAGAIVFPRYRELDLCSLELVERIRVDQDVLVVAGAHCGVEGYLRFGFGERTDYLTRALDRVGPALAAARRSR